MPEEDPVSNEIQPEECRFKPWWFFGALLTPAIVSLITTPLILQNEEGKGIQFGLALLAIASVAAGLFCGIHFTRAQQSLSPGLKWAVGIVSVIGCTGVTYALAYGGCFLTGMLIYATSGP